MVHLTGRNSGIGIYADEALVFGSANWRIGFIGLFKHILAIIAATLFATQAVAQSQDAEETRPPYVLTLAHSLEPTDAAFAFFLTPLARKITDASRGLLEIEFTRIDEPDTVYAMLQSGAVNAAYFNPNTTPELFPAAETMELPFIATTDPVANSQAAWKFVRKYLAGSAPDIVFLAANSGGPMVVHTKGRRLTSAGKFDGLVAHVPNTSAASLLQTLGAEVEIAPFSRAAGDMARSRIEGALAPWHRMAIGDFLKHAQKHMSTQGNKAITSEISVLAIRKSVLDDLPTELSSIIDRFSGQSASMQAGQAITMGTEIALANLSRQPRTMIVLPPEETAILEKSARLVIRDWLQLRKADGHPAQDWLRDYSKFVGEYR